MKRLGIILFSVLALCASSDAQTEHVLQVSGVVVATDSLLPVPYVTVFRSRDNRGTYSDFQGYFTMPAVAGDTLNFVFFGLKRSTFVIPYDTTQTRISIVQWMEEEAVLLPTVNVLPYPAPHKLRSEILALDLPGDHYYRFNRNIATASNYDGLQNHTEDANREAQELLTARYTNGFRSGGNLLDPSAWSKFMKALRRGDYEKE